MHTYRAILSRKCARFWANVLTHFFAFIRRGETISLRSATHFLTSRRFFQRLSSFVFSFPRLANFQKTSRESFLNARDRLNGAGRAPIRLGRQTTCNSSAGIRQEKRANKEIEPATRFTSRRRFVTSSLSYFPPIASLPHSAACPSWASSPAPAVVDENSSTTADEKMPKKRPILIQTSRL